MNQKQDKEFVPYGDEWLKEMSKLSFEQLYDIFKMNKHHKELKADFIKRIREKMLAESK
jgi:hypothetical protein